MNQILATQDINKSENSKKSKNTNNYRQPRSYNSGTKDIRSVLKFFSFMMIVFGVLLIGNGVLALTSNDTKENNTSSGGDTVPQIRMEIKDDDKVIITVLDEVPIESVVYRWNDEDEKTISNTSTSYVQKIVDIPPDGKNILYVKAFNNNGGIKEEKKEFEVLSTIKVNVTISGNNVEVAASSKSKIQKISYAWDDEEAKEISVDSTSYTMEIEAMIGEHSLKILVVDEDGNRKEEIQKVRGTTKPTLQVTQGDLAYHIEAYDEIGLSRIEITTLKDGKVTSIKSDGKELKFDFPLKEGDDNHIKVVAINTNNVKSDEKKYKWPRPAQE